MAYRRNVTRTVYRIWSPILRVRALLALACTAVYIVLAYAPPATAATTFELTMNNTFLLALLDICALVVYLSLGASMVVSPRGLVYGTPFLRKRVAIWGAETGATRGGGRDATMGDRADVGAAR
jgi:hypothetical protein